MPNPFVNPPGSGRSATWRTVLIEAPSQVLRFTNVPPDITVNAKLEPVDARHVAGLREDQAVAAAERHASKVLPPHFQRQRHFRVRCLGSELGGRNRGTDCERQPAEPSGRNALFLSNFLKHETKV
jgi:hypothetical protein